MVRTTIAGLALALWMLPLLTLRADDRITLHARGEIINGKVKKAELEGVEVEIADPRTKQVAKRTVRPSEIAEIEWDVNEPDFRNGVASFKGNNYAQAAIRFQGLATNPEAIQDIRAEARPYLLYMYGESLYRAGRPADAVPVFEKLMNDFKTSMYVTQAVGSLVDASIQSKELAKVPKLLGQLRQLGEDNKSMADYYEGQLFLAEGKVKDAEARFQSASTTPSPSTRGLALMGLARCAIANKDLNKARTVAQQALATNPPANVAGEAHLVVGESILAELDGGKADNMEARLMDALLEFMRVLEQYPGYPNTEPVAMLRAGETLQRLGRLPNRAVDKQRAFYVYNKLLSDSRYKNTRWGQQAAENIRKP